MLDFIRQKGSRLWPIFFKSIFFVWLYIAINVLILWTLWLGLQNFNKLAFLYSVILMLIILGFLVPFMIVCWRQTGSNVELDEIDYIGNYLKGRWFVGSVISFSTAVAMSDVRILMFPIAFTHLMVSLGFFLPCESTYGEDVIAANNLERQLLSYEKEKVFLRMNCFMAHLAQYFLAFFIIFFVMAVIGIGSITNMFTLGAISLTATLVLFTMIACSGFICYPIHQAGISISKKVVDDLKSIYPEGLDVERIQFLLHDTLKQTEGQNNNLNTIKKLLRIFPSSVIYIADEEGGIPFRLACQYSSVEVVKYMIELDNDLLNIRDCRGNTVIHYACQGNNYKVINYLLNRHMILAITRNFDGDLPVYILCSDEHLWISSLTVIDGGAFVSSSYNGKDALNPQHLDTVMRLMLAYPEDMQEKLRAASPSKVLERSMSSEEVPLSTPALTGQAVDSEEGGVRSPSCKPQKPLKLLIYIILVNMTAAVYIGSLQSLSNTNQMKYESEVKQLVDELVASQNETNLLRSRMEALKYLHGASGAREHIR